MPDQLPPRSGSIGQPLPRAESRRLAAGGGRYLDDHATRGEWHAAFLRSPLPHAGFTLDCAAAAALPGVGAIYTAADLATACQPWQTVSASFPGLVSPPQGPLAEGRATWQGEPVAIILAASRAIAEDAAEAILADWRELPAVTRLDTALAAEAARTHPELANNRAWSLDLRNGDPEAAFATAALVVGETLSFTRHTGVALEPRGALAEWQDDEVTVRLSHQMPHQMRLHIAEQFGVPTSRVRVICGDVGGGFGIKMHVYQDEMAIIAAARLARRPVRWIADRMESLLADIHAREHIVAARMAVDAQGHILGFDVHDLQGLGAVSVFPRSSTVEAISVMRVIGAPYRFAHARARIDCVLQNKVPTGQYRAVGAPVGCAVTERLVEKAARARGEDGWAFRARNLMPAEEMPCTNGFGAALHGMRHDAVAAKMQALMDLPSLHADIAAGRAAGRLLGLGVAMTVEFTAAGAVVYGSGRVNVAATDTVVVTLEPDGAISAQASITEIGQGIAQGLAQVLADAIGVPAAAVRVQAGDTQAAPHGGGAWSSRGAAIGGEAAWGAGRALRAQLLQAAGALLQAAPDALDIQDGQVVDATGTPRMPLSDLARTMLFRGHEMPGGVSPSLTAAHHYRREQDATLANNGMQAALVELDGETGLVRVLRYWMVGDCGRLLNPLLVDGQYRGGIATGLGEALLEACRYDAENGQFQSGTLADYLLPMAMDVPDIALGHVETPYAGSVLGAKGAGESGTGGVPAAILNAVNDALAAAGGGVVTQMPIQPMDVLRALGRLA
ncbi:xanthine dehydrogenase family protein molybdopterin-binding subunit [Humitalea sp. 24SJ18S-53]|uniref:xanthine dehydrogenase family protein molybdopterin-binding subunit n=1 Tax=Humitalea sp. 24SJ18S-53 TaxID=3422307 RepID=UPI003D672FFF